VASQVSSSIPVVAERAQYWPDPASHWFEAHNSFGTNASARRWGLAEGRVGGPEAYQTYILLANRGTSDAEATLQFLLETGVAFQKVFRVPASGRVNVSIGPGTLVPELIDARFGVVITATEPIAVERSMYWNAGGQVWAAGTNAAATPWP
jgi:hypothetical protein